MLAATLIIAGTVLAAAPASEKPADTPKAAKQASKGGGARQKSPAPLKRDLTKSSKPLEYRYTGGRYHNQLFQYRLVAPSPLRSTERYPLLVWLHGFGRRGEDNKKQLAHLDLIFNSRADLRNRQFFILATQCPGENPQWFGSSKAEAAKGGQSPDDMLTVTVEILRKTMRDYPVDEDRIYLAGPSAGGTACWEMALRYPELFAAVAPMSSGGGTVSRAARLANVPVWAFHNRNDPAIPPRGVEEMIAAVKEAGGKAELTLFDAAEHNSWTAAFANGAMEWMLAQHRGTSGAPPGYRPWRLWHVVTVPATLVIVVWLGWRFGRRKG